MHAQNGECMNDVLSKADRGKDYDWSSVCVEWKVRICIILCCDRRNICYRLTT